MHLPNEVILIGSAHKQTCFDAAKVIALLDCLVTLLQGQCVTKPGLIAPEGGV